MDSTCHRRPHSYFPLDSDGKFEINNLLPGTYLLEIKIAGHKEIAREVVLGIEDANLELTSQREISK